MRFWDHEILRSGDLEIMRSWACRDFFSQKGGKSLSRSRTSGQKSDLLKVLGTAFGDLGVAATGDLQGRRQKGPRPSGTGGKTPASARPKGHHSEGRKLKPRGKNYKELPGITRNYQKLPEAAVKLSGEIYPS